MTTKLDTKNILLKNEFLDIPNGSGLSASKESFVTIISNMVYFGYIPSKEAFNKLKEYSVDELKDFWSEYESVFKKVTFSDRNMDSFMVYKNFPKEVVNMSDAEYWFKQFLIYFGVPVDYLREEKETRPELKDEKSLKVLAISKDSTLNDIFNSNVSKKSSWNDYQKEEMEFLFSFLEKKEVNVSDYGFKDNAILMAVIAFNNQLNLKIKDATDVLRLAAALSDGSLNSKEKFKFKNFKKSERRLILSILDNCKNINEDFAMRKELWKKFMFKLHAGDYKFQNVNKAVDLLYNNKVKTFNATVDGKIMSKDNEVLDILASRHGEFVRRFHKLYEVFGVKAVNTLEKVISNFETIQILKFKKYILTINDRNNLIFAPRGNWTKAVIVKKETSLLSDKKNEVIKTTLNKDVVSAEKLKFLKENFGIPVTPKDNEYSVKVNKSVSSKVEIKKTHLSTIVKILDKELKKRLNEKFPEGLSLDVKLKDVKIPSNDQSLDVNFGRGTKFDIPDNCKTVRTSSYWKVGENSTVWFDNGWNFFDEKWNSKSSICWNNTSHMGALFSGDPLSGNDKLGRACQVIDLDIEVLKSTGVRYCVWNILCFSQIPFNGVEEVIGTLQFADDSETGEVFEPSRMHMGFPLKGDNLTKYVAYIDLVERKLVYMDANFTGIVQSASYNGKGLETKMPAFLEYLDTLPSVYDLFENANKGKTKVLFTDKGVKVKDSAYVFKRENEKNDFENIDIAKLLK